jgi:hypothetical protein
VDLNFAKARFSAQILMVAAPLLLFQFLFAVPLVGVDLASQRNVPVEGQVGY